MWDLIVSVPDHCLSFYFTVMRPSRVWFSHRIFRARINLQKVNPKEI